MEIKFSIIVPVYNTGKYLAGCIQALRELDYPASQYEILMVDNNSTDNSAEILAKADGVRVFKETKQGSYAARNHALRVARGEYLAFTDSDCMPLPNWLKSIEKNFEDPVRHIVMGPRLSDSKNRAVQLLADFQTKKDEIVFGSKVPDVYYGFTNNLSVRKSTMDRFGPFEERARGADVIFVRRVVSGLGCDAVCYDTQMSVRHAELDSIMSHYKKMYTYGKSCRLYQQVVRTRPLLANERFRALRTCIVEGKYTSVEMLLFAGVLVGGVIAWNSGSLAARVQGLRGKHTKVLQQGTPQG
jgi:glycosyltransferase involved in cell wall biosynthesis